MVKKRMVLVVALLFIVSVVATVALAADVTTIQYAFWGNPTAIGVEKDIIDAFEKAHPDIKVTPVVAAYNDYHTKLLTLFAGGQAPDVMRIDSYYMADFMKNKALKDVSGLIKHDKVNLDAYYDVGLQDCMKGNKYYGLPWGTAPVYLFVNTKMFKDAGISMPSVDWKYDDFIKIAKQLSKGTGLDRQYGLGIFTWDMTCIFPFIWSDGGDLFDKSRKKFTLDQPAAYQKLQEMANLIKEGVAPDPSQLSSPDILTRWFANNKLAMRIGAASDILTLQAINNFEFEVLPFPGTARYPKCTIVKSNVVGICSTTKKEAAAWEFLKFLRAPGQPGETLYMQAKRIPPSIDDPELWKLYADPTKSPKMLIETCKAGTSKYGHTLPLRSGWIEIQSLVIPELQRVFAGQITAVQAMKEVAPKVKDVVTRVDHQ